MEQEGEWLSDSQERKLMPFDKKAYMLEYTRHDRECARKAGYCIVCRKRKAIKGESQCKECKERKRKYEQARRTTQEYKMTHNAYRRERNVI